MKGSKKVLDQLNELLKGELTAADQYFVHSEMYSDWGLVELYERLHHEFQEELDHAKKLIERILFLEGVPQVGARDELLIGKDVPGMLKNDLTSELSVGAALRKAIKICEEEQDYQSREILVRLLEDTEEDHTYWLEKQLGLIDKMGLENYIQSKVSA